MRIVLTADTHVGLDHPITPQTGRRHRGADFLANLDRVLAYATSTHADLVLHGGDVFDTPVVPDTLVDQVYQRLVGVAERGIPVAVIGGNHERAVLPPSLLAVHPHLHVFTRPAALRLDTAHGTVTLVGIPYMRGDVQTAPARVLESLQLPPADVTLLLLHQAVEGATVGPQDFVFRRRQDVVSMDALPRGFDAVLSGHIHRAQVLWAVVAGRRVPVIYPGSVERTSFAEQDEPKSFAELRVEQGTRWLTRHPLPARALVTAHAAGATRTQVAARLHLQVASFPPDAVVRLSGESHALALLNREMVDEVFPLGMSIQWSHARLESQSQMVSRQAANVEKRRLFLFGG